MKTLNLWKAIFVALLALLLIAPASAQQPELAALLEVLEGSVEVNRVNTEQWIAVRVEAIVGVGDRIRTDATGRARITFFADGIETEILAASEMRIEQFRGSEEAFELNVEVLIGQTAQRIQRALDSSSSYLVTTPGMTLAARGTEFTVRVEDGGRSAMLVTEGTVDAGKSAQSEDAQVPSGFGVRAAVDSELSDVVRATTFAELDAALDGCPATLTTPDDVSLNVRLAPQIDAPRIGTVSAAEVGLLYGVTEGGDWYRIAFRGGFAWILSSTATIPETCAGLRVFPNDHPFEDASLYESLGDPLTLDELPPSPAETPETDSGG
ncbi:MAG: FecR domain-containing protein [Chloroflexi bacterium]|nr:FecR domain-containing protein [Chloroflexota bacterium]